MNFWITIQDHTKYACTKIDKYSMDKSNMGKHNIVKFNLKFQMLVNEFTWEQCFLILLETKMLTLNSKFLNKKENQSK